MAYPDKFTGFQVESAETWQDFHKNEFQPKPFGDYDVDVKVECCGICASDLHTINGEWGPQNFPLAVGHGKCNGGFGDHQQPLLARELTSTFFPEIVGTALRVGPKVSLIKPGQRVGVGAQSYSCLNCRQCNNDNETYCADQLDTYGAKWPDTGIISQGGYSSHVRTHEHWCVGPGSFPYFIRTFSGRQTDVTPGSSPSPTAFLAPWRHPCSAPV